MQLLEALDWKLMHETDSLAVQVLHKLCCELCKCVVIFSFFLVNCEFFYFFPLQKTSLDMETEVQDDLPISIQVQFKRMHFPKLFSQHCNYCRI
jgi:hypothetical protein